MSYTAPRVYGFGLAIASVGQWSCVDSRSNTAGTWPTADLAIYVPVRVPRRVIVVKMGIGNSSAVSGNFDLGIYDAGGTRLVSTGTTAHSGTTTDQIVNVTDTAVGPGLYYFAAVFDNTTANVYCANTMTTAPQPLAHGVLVEQLGAGGALPSTATFALGQTLGFVPIIVALLEATPA